jgi:hypothetical protein
MHAAIVTIKNDLHAFAVSKAMENRHGWKCDVIEADCLADTGGLNWSPDDANAPGVLPNRDGGSVPVSTLDVVWWRRFFYNQIALPADVSDPTAIDVITGDCRVSAMGVMLSDFRGAWVSHPDATRRAENKLVQLRAARGARRRLQNPQDPGQSESRPHSRIRCCPRRAGRGQVSHEYQPRSTHRRRGGHRVAALRSAFAPLPGDFACLSIPPEPRLTNSRD